jgi:uncharacterized caspase-like protein
MEEAFKVKLASVAGGARDALMTRGLARMSAQGDGLIIAYATQANDVAFDGNHMNSPFTTAFLRNVATPNLDLRQMLFRVQDEVNQETGGRQRPEISISLFREVKLVSENAQ